MTLAAQADTAASMTRQTISLFLAGDVMTGRGIDQILPHPGDPRIHESYLNSALGYIEIAEAVNGPIPRPVTCAYIWGDAMTELSRTRPDFRIVNLETSITAADDYWKGKGIHYRMHPDNTACLSAAGFDVVSLANNHVLDWGFAGLSETLESLENAGIGLAGAGRNSRAAGLPAIISIEGKGRVIVFAFGHASSGVPAAWAATETTAGINLLTDLSDATVGQIGADVERIRKPGDIVVVSIHWGGNWGYQVPADHIRFARRLIDSAGVDLVHGHSSHHPRPVEVYRDRLIIYGTGDFFNDYEGIGGYESFRSDLVFMYFADIDPGSGHLIRLRMIPMQIKRFSLHYATQADAAWLLEIMNRAGEQFGTSLVLHDGKPLTLSTQVRNFNPE